MEAEIHRICFQIVITILHWGRGMTTPTLLLEAGLAENLIKKQVPGRWQIFVVDRGCCQQTEIVTPEISGANLRWHFYALLVGSKSHRPQKNVPLSGQDRAKHLTDPKSSLKMFCMGTEASTTFDSLDFPVFIGTLTFFKKKKQQILPPPPSPRFYPA